MIQVVLETKSFNGKPILQTVTGQAARTLLVLVESGSEGITRLEVLTGPYWLINLHQYIYRLRYEFLLDISTTKEPYIGRDGRGRHARYELLTPVKILSVKH